MPPPALRFKTYKGTTDHPENLEKYIRKEKQKGAVIDPFNVIPFNKKCGHIIHKHKVQEDSSGQKNHF